VILGLFDREAGEGELEPALRRAAERVCGERETARPRIWVGSGVALCSLPAGIASLDEAPQPFVSEDGAIAAVFEGKVHNGAELRQTLGSGHRFETDCSGEILVHLYEKHGDGFLDAVNGKFSAALWDERSRRLVLARDRLGIQPLFYADDGRRLVFASSMRALLRSGWIDRELSHDAVLQYLLYSFNPAHPTLIRGVRRLPPGHLLTVDGAEPTLRRYWRLSFAETRVQSEEDYCAEILDLIEQATRIRLESERPPGVFLSGGTDSSAIVSLASKMRGEPLPTFSFRCRGPSYDESSYARFVAEEYGTRHTEIEYGPEALRLMSEAVAAMDEPFCDVGIEIATYLLGRAAHGQVSYVFSGEGGDELFGGHPVYVADKFAVWADRLPGALRVPAARLLQLIPDAAEKNNLQVKLKRFAYGLSFPPGLLSHRWGIYYTPAELRELCTEDFLASCDLGRVFEPVLAYGEEADGKDILSRSLYGHYQTLVSFYLRRLGLLRAFDIESRVPLLDHRLVEYAATVPSRLKIRGLSDSKYIYRRALEKILPRKILYDRPKLGHSVPLKNWLRDDGEVKQWVGDMLSGETLSKRGLFRPAVVRRLIDEHSSRRNNHSHRLWALTVLELWMREWLDG
jgi:asparagine synthase (glutamine-hydrolysing)